MFSIRPYKLKARETLGTRQAGILIICLAFAARVLHLFFFYNLIVDASYQVLATESFVHGHGFSTAIVNPYNLSQVIYRPLINWPPGYSLLLSPLYVLFGYRYIPAAITLDVAMAFVFIIVCRKILRSLSVPSYLINLCTLVNGFFIYHFYFIASSDGIAVPFFLIGIYQALRLLQKQGRPWLNTTVMIVSLGMVGYLKYLFMPIVFALPLYLTAIGFINKDRLLKRTGLAAFLSLFAFIGVFLFHQIQTSGAAGYISAQGRGWFPQHLLDTFPFITGSFLKPDTAGVFFGVSTDHRSVFYILWQSTNLLLVVFVLCFFFYYITKKNLRHLSPAAHFFQLCFLLSLLVFQVLAILSLQVEKEEILPGWFWTYVEEARYYGLVNVLFHLGAFVFYRFALPKVAAVVKIIFWGLVFLLGIETVRGVLFTVNRIRLFGKEEYSWQYEDRFQKAADAVVKKAKALYRDAPVVVGGSSYYYSHRVSLYSHVPVLYDLPVAFNPSLAKTTKPVVLINMINRKTAAAQTLSALKSGKLAGSFDDFDFYIVYVAPL